MTDATLERALPVGSMGRHANGWWGMMMLIATEGALFVYLLFSYYYVAVQHGREWLPTDLPNFKLSAPDTLILLASSVVAWRGEKLLKEGRGGAVVALHLAITGLMGILFVAIQYKEWSSREFTPTSSSYGSLYYTITGFHMMHVIAGILVLATLTLWSALGYFDQRRSAAVSIGAIYWHFVDAVWLVLFLTFYITPRLNVG
jgi:heme/copper-type cytochrome/quinol oxidase subunit 3